MRFVVEPVALVEGQYLFFYGFLRIGHGRYERKQVESTSGLPIENATGGQDITGRWLDRCSHRSAKVLAGLINKNIVGEKPAIPDQVSGCGKGSYAATDDVSLQFLLPIVRSVSIAGRP
jgi:hypothetical protein